MTARRDPARAIYLDVAPDPVFAMFHPGPAVDSSNGHGGDRTGVLIAPPFGWHDVASYRARRTWSEALAAAGHPTLRIDLPGTGDSGGTTADPGRVDAWTAAIDAAARWLRAQPGVDRIAVIGLALGGLVAASALEAGAPVDDLVLWGTPSQGRQLVRQERAFAGLQGSRYSITGEPEPRFLPDGWLEVNGFVLSADTLKTLDGIDLRTIETGVLTRALLLEADGLPVDAALHDAWAGRGIDVSERPGPGWAAMTFHPERYEPPLEVMTTVAGWLADAHLGAADRAAHPTQADRPPPVDHPTTAMRWEAAVVHESTVRIEIDAGWLFGIVAEPPDGVERAPVAAVFLDAGAVRRIGPNRIWVDAARRFAARGVPTLRLDLEGIGDSDGNPERYRDVAEFYIRDTFGDQISAFVDAIEARGAGPRIMLAGLCAGGYWAFHGAARDRRVTAALLLNPGAVMWRSDLVRRRDAHKVRRLLQPTWMRRLLRGKVPMSRVRAIATAVARSAAVPGTSGASSPEPLLDALRARDVDVLLAFSADEALESELEASGLLARLHRWPNVIRRRLPGRDHTLRPIVAQRAVHALLDEALDRELARCADVAPPPAVATAAAGGG
jgi:alpha-beta hydrolase superfamily lysophospholipase